MNLDHLKMTEEALPRLRAKRAANRGVVTKLIKESNEIFGKGCRTTGHENEKPANEDRCDVKGKIVTYQRARRANINNQRS